MFKLTEVIYVSAYTANVIVSVSMLVTAQGQPRSPCVTECKRTVIFPSGCWQNDNVHRPLKQRSLGSHIYRKEARNTDKCLGLWKPQTLLGKPWIPPFMLDLAENELVSSWHSVCFRFGIRIMLIIYWCFSCYYFAFTLNGGLFVFPSSGS